MHEERCGERGHHGNREGHGSASEPGQKDREGEGVTGAGNHRSTAGKGHTSEQRRIVGLFGICKGICGVPYRLC